MLNDKSDMDSPERKLYRLTNCIGGVEDDIIGLASISELKKVILGSKLNSLYHDDRVDVVSIIQEYLDGAKAIGKPKDYLITTDYEGTFWYSDTFERLGQGQTIADDRNLYLYLATHLKEMGMSFEKYTQYIPCEFIKDNRFFSKLKLAADTGEYSYQDESSLKAGLGEADFATVAITPEAMGAKGVVYNYLKEAKTKEDLNIAQSKGDE